MGNYSSRINNAIKTSQSPSTPYQSQRFILINQANCLQCNMVLTDRGICKCGNVEIYGGREELGRRVKKTELYSDVSLLEYRPIVL